MSHWLKVDRSLREAVDADIGDTVTLEIAPVQHEPEPELLPDLCEALAAAPEARAGWEAATTIARLDWIHLITSVKQSKTRVQRVVGACDRLTAGKRRVCCFDPSGYHSKAFGASEAAD